MKPFVVAAFYKFVALDDLPTLRESLLQLCEENNIKGTILLAQEGINSTISGDETALQRVLEALQNDERIGALTVKFSQHQAQPFGRMKVKIKPEIVTLGLPEISPTKAVGTYVKPSDWNDLISQPDVFVVDTRNDYEVRVGSFEGAVNPQTRTFREFPEYVKENLETGQHKRVAMFCTGGIRCEKASSMMLEYGFENVYHLEGGVLQYLEYVPRDESLFHGECFVFDERVALDHELQRGEYSLCGGCGNPVKLGDKLCEKCVEQQDT